LKTAGYGNWFPIFEKEDAVRRFVKKGDLVLELGCFNKVYEEAVTKAGGHYVGIDVKLWFGHRKPDIQCDAQKLPFRNSCFDVVLAFDIIEHVENPIQVLRESYRVTKPYGLILVTVPLMRYAEYDPSHLHTYTGEILRRQLTYVGWHVTQLQEEKIFYHRYNGNIFAVAVKPK